MDQTTPKFWVGHKSTTATSEVLLDLRYVKSKLQTRATQRQAGSKTEAEFRTFHPSEVSRKASEMSESISVFDLGPNLDLLSTGAVSRSERFGKERMTMVNYNTP